MAGEEPAGAGGRPPLPVASLDGRAWRVLRWRQDHLPVDLLRRPADLQALSLLEQHAAWRLAERLGLDDDQRYSLLWHHLRQVERQLAAAGAGLTAAPPRPLPVRRHAVFNGAAGWGAWLANRKADLSYRWFRARMLRHGRAAPEGP